MDDQRDGTYRNPVLPGDYNEIDCIRVGDDFYAISLHYAYSGQTRPSKHQLETK